MSMRSAKNTYKKLSRSFFVKRCATKLRKDFCKKTKTEVKTENKLAIFGQGLKITHQTRSHDNLEPT